MSHNKSNFATVMSKFIEAILPLPLPGTYTYSIPAPLKERIAVGCRVSVPLGEKRSYTALVSEIHDREPQGYKAKPIKELLDEEPVVTEIQLKLSMLLFRSILIHAPNRGQGLPQNGRRRAT